MYLESDHLSFFTYPNIQTRRFTSAFHRALVVRGGNGLQFFTVPRGEELPPLPKKIVEEEGTDEDSVRSVTPDSTEPGKEACASEPLLSAAVILSNFIY